MKTITIRFIKRSEDYLIQKKTWLGWKYIFYSQKIGCGGSIDTLYCENTKEELLFKVLELHYNIDKRFVKVIEHPEIKYY